jgi:uncharacterized glyoxalase superfamily metalloenzyme YdcJ
MGSFAKAGTPLTNPFGSAAERAGAAILSPASPGVDISVVVAWSVHQAVRDSAYYRRVYRAHKALARMVAQVKNLVILSGPRTSEQARVARAVRRVTIACS